MLPDATICAIRKDLVFITDRDANVCYIYSVPEFELLGTFAEDLKQPMGITTYRRATDGAVFAYIVQKRGEGDAKVIRYRIVEENGKLKGQRELQFGNELTVNQETVMADGKRELVYVADETARDIKVYDLDGKFQRSFGKGIFQAQVEGIVIASCGEKESGYIIASDQRRTTEFEFFDRATFKHLGTIKGTAKITDGIALSLASLPDYPNGLFIAQSDPQATGGRHAEFYDFGQMLKRLKLPLLKCR
jgi:myo-inositol-hexaphosphate 3-phosphohydrolase